MKLEIKHLAPYLPYGLEVMYCPKEKGFNSPNSIANITKNGFGQDLLFGLQEGFVKIFGLKPKTFLHELQDEIYIRWGGGISKEAKGYWLKGFTDNLMYTAYPALKFDEIEFMAEYHIDIFGLINQGLAVAE